MNRYSICAAILMAIGITLLPGQTGAPTQTIYATLQKPGAPRGYLNSSLKTGTDGESGFFTVKGEILRLANVDYHIKENDVKSQNNQTYSLKDAKGRSLVWADNGSVSVSATPAENAQWFRIRFFTAAQRDEIENRRRAEQQRDAGPDFSSGPGS